MPGGLSPPIEVILKWAPLIDYEHPERSGYGVVVLTGVLLGLAYIVVGMRLWARYRIVKNAGIDDVLILLNMIPLTGMSVALMLSYFYWGFDRHVWDLQAPTIIAARKVQLAIESAYMGSVCLTKISILLFYRRLTAGTIGKAFQWTVHLAIASVLAYFVVFHLTLFLCCRPLFSSWKQGDFAWLLANRETFTCWDEGKILVATAVVSAIQDFVACGLPMILFWKLHISKRQKIVLGGIFALGGFLCVCSVIRTYYIWKVYNATYDMTWEGRPAWMWLSIEANVAVMCASAPALKVFFKHSLAGPTTRYVNYLRRTPYARQGKEMSGGSDETEDSIQALPTIKSSRFGRKKLPVNRIGKLGTWDVSYDDEERYSELEHEMRNFQSKPYTAGKPTFETTVQGNAKSTRGSKYYA
ncbi:hypothetical protein EJ08DRAFT_44817 [Tothia fuscella]|uniref:Rhodopsin domain-containing protein n=1 Tax=Tothia fuscella TaxID=1048955 RepID=A0A9P4NG12_9PEZI|nr:hypothetical protein EJ08DRAFT_44817 [Tothia fuscella]